MSPVVRPTLGSLPRSLLHWGQLSQGTGSHSPDHNDDDDDDDDDESLAARGAGDEPHGDRGPDRPPALSRQAARQQQPRLGQVQRLHHPHHRHRHRDPRQEVQDRGVGQQGGLGTHHQVETSFIPENGKLQILCAV